MLYIMYVCINTFEKLAKTIRRQNIVTLSISIFLVGFLIIIEHFVFNIDKHERKTERERDVETSTKQNTTFTKHTA